MSLFSLGDKVIDRTTFRKGRVVEVYPAGRGGRQVYKVIFINAGEEDVLETSLNIDFDISDPYERCCQNMFDNYYDFSNINTTFKIKNSNNSTISSLKASKTLFRAYQFKPLLKFLNSDNKRLLIADEVGLGKTIEAGHILLEIKARDEFRNALIVCPRSLRLKWQDELHDKFGLDFKIYDDNKNIKEDLKHNNGSFRGIVTYEKIRFAKEMKSDGQLGFVEMLELQNVQFSIILCDEAHRLRNSDTQTYKGAKRLMKMASAAVFLTATPIMISYDNLYNLLHLLDEDRYSDITDFRNNVEVNKPFVRALSQLANGVSLNEIAQNLETAQLKTSYVINDEVRVENHSITDLYADFPIYQRIISQLKTDVDTNELRVKIQYDLLSMSEMNNIFSRTRKVDVTVDMNQAQAVRQPHLVSVELSLAERTEFNKIIDKYYTPPITHGKALGLVQKKRQVASSVYAYLNDDYDLDAGIDRFSHEKDSKVDELLKIIDEVFSLGTRKIIVFTLFKKTIKYLGIRLKTRGYKCAIIHGDIDNRDEVLAAFRDDPEYTILLSTDVGSEGLDMQFCNSMVNYDLPWNPMVVEQRIGRIDRFGQQSEIVHIFNMVVKNSIQEEIYDRLLDRIDIFRNAIGDIEAILDAEINIDGQSVRIKDLYNKFENELLCCRLTPKQRKTKMEQIALAIEQEKKTLHDIDTGLTNTLTNDSYFRQEINRILKNNSFVTENELYNYLESVIKTRLTTLSLSPIKTDPTLFRLYIPSSSLSEFKNFLTQYQPIGRDYDIMFRQFLNNIDEQNELLLTFDQDRAYKSRGVMFVNIYNPLIQATLEYFLRETDTSKKTFRFIIPQLRVKDILDNTKYILCIYQISTSQIIYGRQKRNDVLYPILFDIDNDCIVDKNDIADHIFGISQEYGEYMFEQSSPNMSADEFNKMRSDITEYVTKHCDDCYNELKMRVENERRKQVFLIEERTRIRIERLENAKEKEKNNPTGTLNLLQSNLDKLINESTIQLKRINADPEIKVLSSLSSLSYIQII